MTLPVYYSWAFTTGGPGDFRDLATRLTARTGVDLVRATLDLTGSGLSAAGTPISKALDLGGALVPLSSSTPAPPDDDIRHALAASISPAPGVLPIPCYGAAYSGLTRLSADMRGWATELNLDPRW